MGLRTNFRKLKTEVISYYNSIKAYLFPNRPDSPTCIAKKNLSFNEILIYYTPDWYHDFSILGFKTLQLQGENSKEAQENKQYIIFDHIKEGVQYIKNKYGKEYSIQGTELFCADGFYSNFALQNGVDFMYGIDLEGSSVEGKKRSSVLDQARLISKLLGNEAKVNFEKCDVYNLQGEYDICLCLGGLYHLPDPEKLINILSQKITKALVIQTVISLETEDENYFEAPAPGWNWGCRFSHKYLINMLERNGWKVIKEDRNQLACNYRLCDKGSSYILCIKD